MKLYTFIDRVNRLMDSIENNALNLSNIKQLTSISLHFTTSCGSPEYIFKVCSKPYMRMKMD